MPMYLMTPLCTLIDQGARPAQTLIAPVGGGPQPASMSLEALLRTASGLRSRSTGVAIALWLTIANSHQCMPAEAVPSALEKSSQFSRLQTEARFELNTTGPEVVILRNLLTRAGFVDAKSDKPELYDLALMKVVRAFQVSRGLKSTGIPRELTIAALNAAPSLAARQPASARLSESADQTGSIPSVASFSDTPTLDAGSAKRMTEALSRFVAMQKDLSLRKLPISTSGQRTGLSKIGPLVSRLSAERYLPADYATDRADADDVVSGALKEWQRHYGLAATGSLDSETYNAINVPISDRVQQLKASLQRAKALEGKLNGFYVVVNAAAAEVQVVNDGVLLAKFPAVVGRGSRRTPEFVSAIPDIQLAPTWTVPQSIIQKDIAPLMRTDPEYLNSHKMQASVGDHLIDPKSVDWRKGPFPKIVQRPGRHNALGLVRFGMTNGGAHYIHGTAQPNLLRRRLSKRFLSSGCVRVGDPVALAALLLRTFEPFWTAERIRERIAAHDGGWQPGERITLKRPVPAFWTYLTAWVTADGRPHFRADVYQRNEALPNSGLLSGHDGRPDAGARPGLRLLRLKMTLGKTT